jgi:PadR family transcriptional regulator, regulatory protein PadR
VTRRSRKTTDAVAGTASLDEAKVAAGVPDAGESASSLRPGSADPFAGELRRGGLLPLLVLHFAAQGPAYGNQLMDRIQTLTAGALAVNPNTMYPLLRSLESRGLVAGEWEHPERRSRRFYRITGAGEEELARLAAEIEPRLERVARGVELVRRELTRDSEAGG